MTNFTITQNGQPLNPSKYTWDETTKTLKTEESNLKIVFEDSNINIIALGSQNIVEVKDNSILNLGNSCKITAGTGNFLTTRDYNKILINGGNTITPGRNCRIIRLDLNLTEIFTPRDFITIKLNGIGVPGSEVVDDLLKH